jgi:hypothetical protein
MPFLILESVEEDLNSLLENSNMIQRAFFVVLLPERSGQNEKPNHEHIVTLLLQAIIIQHFPPSLMGASHQCMHRNLRISLVGSVFWFPRLYDYVEAADNLNTPPVREETYGST